MKSDKTDKPAIDKKPLADYRPLFQDIFSYIKQAKRKAYSQVNIIIIELFWTIVQYFDRQIEKCGLIWMKGDRLTC